MLSRLKRKPWQWAVIYDDDSRHTEQELSSFQNVEVDRIVALELVPSSGRPIRLDTRGKVATAFRRHRLSVDPNGIQPQRHEQVACIGYESEQGNCYVWGFEDGSVFITSDVKAV